MGVADRVGDPVWPIGIAASKWEPLAPEVDGVYSGDNYRGCCWLSSDATMDVLIGGRPPKFIYLDVFVTSVPPPPIFWVTLLVDALTGHREAEKPESPQVITVTFENGQDAASRPLADGFSEVPILVPRGLAIRNGTLHIMLHMSRSFRGEDLTRSGNDTRILSLILREVISHDDASKYLVTRGAPQAIQKLRSPNLS